MGVVTIRVSTFTAEVRGPFEAKDTIKTMPDRRWDQAARCWLVPPSDVPLLKELLEDAGFRVVVNRPSHEQSDAPPPPRGGRNARTWADDMFTALGPELGGKAYKALVRVIHPDSGGSAEQMKVLNAARDRAGLAA